MSCEISRNIKMDFRTEISLGRIMRKGNLTVRNTVMVLATDKTLVSGETRWELHVI